VLDRCMLCVTISKPSLVDPNRDNEEEPTYKGLNMILTDSSFVLNLGVLLDALTELEDLSLELQKHSTSLISAHKL
jgi:hypothetical protein